MGDVLTLEAEKYAFDMNVVNDLEDCELNIVYHVSGYVALQINNRITCGCFKTVFISSNACTSVVSENNEHSDFLELINRGGLMASSDFLYVICLYILLLCSKIQRKFSSVSYF